MAAGDILSCEVLATGWQAKVVIEGFVDGGAYNFGDIDADVANAKLTMTVVSEGYNASGTLGTKTRYVYGTRVCQKAYPNHAVAEETESGGNVELTVALSDYVYDDDNTGAGKSGTAPTVTIASGWYTDSGTGGSSAASNATTALAVTNSSTQDYPKVIARWAVVPYQRVVSTFDLEAVAFHRFAESGKPVACVVFSHTDASTDAVASTAMVKSSAADALPCYQRTITASDYTDNTVYNWQFTAYPWVGDADSTITTVGGSANALTLGPLPLLMDSDDDYGVTLVCVNTSTGNDTSGVASPTYATAAANPCATIFGALGKIAGYNNTNYSRNNANAGVVYLQSNNHSWGDGYAVAATGDVWVTVTRDPNVAKADARITGAPNGIVETARLRLYDLTIIPTGFVIRGQSGRVLWQDQTNNIPATQQTSQTVWGYDLTYNTFCTADKLSYPWGHYSTGNVPALIRGCSATNVAGTGTSASYGPRCLLSTTLDHADAQSGQLAYLSASNSVVAYCRDLRNPDNSSGSLNVEGALDHVAVVCNLLEDTAGTTYTAGFWPDTSVASNTNFVCWHNTIAGERVNIGYNEGASAVTRSLYSVKFNAMQRLATKHDVFKTDGTRIGAWSVLYGVGWVGNHQEYTGTDFIPNYAGIRGTRNAAAGYTSDLSGAAGVGGGDYTPDTGSVLISKIATAADVVIPWDINGVAYAAGGCAGAITLAGGSILLHAQHYYRMLRG